MKIALLDTSKLGSDFTLIPISSRSGLGTEAIRECLVSYYRGGQFAAFDIRCHVGGSKGDYITFSGRVTVETNTISFVGVAK